MRSYYPCPRPRRLAVHLSRYDQLPEDFHLPVTVKCWAPNNGGPPSGGTPAKPQPQRHFRPTSPRAQNESRVRSRAACIRRRAGGSAGLGGWSRGWPVAGRSFRSASALGSTRCRGRRSLPLAVLAATRRSDLRRPELAARRRRRARR